MFCRPRPVEQSLIQADCPVVSWHTWQWCQNDGYLPSRRCHCTVTSTKLSCWLTVTGLVATPLPSSVCLRAYLWKHASRLHQIFGTCYLRPWLDPPLVMLWYGMYFRSCRWCHLCPDPSGQGNESDSPGAAPGAECDVHDCLVETAAEATACWYSVGTRLRCRWPGFKSQSQRCQVTVLGKLFTPIVPLFTKQQNW